MKAFRTSTFLVLLVTGCAHVSDPEKTLEDDAAGKGVQSDEVETVYLITIPNNLEECFDHLKKYREDDLVREVFSGNSEMSVADYLKRRSSIASSWYLWSDSSLAKYFHRLGVYNPDHMLKIIFTSYARHLEGEPIQLKEQIEELKAL